MAYVDWRIKGPELSTCNCDWGCPCQFNALPSRGYCRAAVAMRIDEGHFGEVRLDGLHWVSLLAWPGPIHHGDGYPRRRINVTQEDDFGDCHPRRSCVRPRRTSVRARLLHFENAVRISRNLHRRLLLLELCDLR